MKYIKIVSSFKFCLIILIAVTLAIPANLAMSQISVDFVSEQTLGGHDETVTSIAFSPDGEILASGSNDKTVRFWDVKTGQLIRTLNGHEDEVKAIAFFPNGKILVSVTWNGFIRFWNVQTGELIRTFAHKIPYRTIYGLSQKNSILWAVAISPDGKSMATGGQYRKNSSESVWNGRIWSGTVRLWNLPKGESLRNLEWHYDAVYTLAFSNDSKIIASGSADKTIQFCNSQTGELIKTLEGHTDSVLSIAFSPTEKIMASGSADKTVRLWDAETGNMLRTLEGHEDSVLSVCFSKYGKTLASGSRDGTIKIWDVQRAELLATLTGHKGGVTEVDFSPDRSMIASSSVDKTIKIWRIK